MSDHRQEYGRWGEREAVAYLRDKGYEILRRNYRVGRGEIDIIARIEDTIVFGEVKSGQRQSHGAPEARIGRRKQRQLYRIANGYIQSHPGWRGDYRFDAVIIDGRGGGRRIRHYENAFYLFD